MVRGAAKRPALPTAEMQPPRGFALRLWQFIHLAWQRASFDALAQTSAALAFVTGLSLIPLLAAFSFVGARVFEQYQQRSFEVFVQILPYTEKPITDKIAEFLAQARALHGFGVLAFFVTTMLLFGTVEQTINRIWSVDRRRPLRYRVLSFLLLLFWGPTLLGATFSSLILLRQSATFQTVVERSTLLSLLPFVAALVGSTLLYKLVPATPVRWTSALAGGLFAAICLELLRRGFGLYVELAHNVSAIYGSFAFLLLFLISIQATWAILLFGCEIAYVAQHYAVLSRGLHRHPPMQASWVGLAALTVIADRFLRGQPALSEDDLAVRLHVSTAELDRIVHPLLSHDLLRKTSAGEPGYLLAADPHEITLEQIFQAYDHRARRAVQPLDKNLRDRLESLVAGLATSRSTTLAQASLNDLLENDETTLDLGPAA